MNKKILFGVVAFMIIIISLFFISGCAVHPNNPSDGNQSGSILLKDGTIIDNIACAKLDKVIVIHEAGCPACATALPRLRELEQELNTNFTYYDLAIDKDKEEVLSMNLIPVSIPVIIVNCKVYVGAKSKEEFKSIITPQ